MGDPVRATLVERRRAAAGAHGEGRLTLRFRFDTRRGSGVGPSWALAHRLAQLARTYPAFRVLVVYERRRVSVVLAFTYHSELEANRYRDQALWLLELASRSAPAPSSSKASAAPSQHG